MEIKGKVHVIGDIINVTDTFKKRELVVQYAEHPHFIEHIKFEILQDRMSILDDLSVGDEVEVSFNLRGRPWTNKEGVEVYFNTLVAWRVNKIGSAQGQPVTGGAGSYAAPLAVDVTEGSDDDLPF